MCRIPIIMLEQMFFSGCICMYMGIIIYGLTIVSMHDFTYLYKVQYKSKYGIIVHKTRKRIYI